MTAIEFFPEPAKVDANAVDEVLAAHGLTADHDFPYVDFFTSDPPEAYIDGEFSMNELLVIAALMKLVEM